LTGARGAAGTRKPPNTAAIRRWI